MKTLSSSVVKLYARYSSKAHLATFVFTLVLFVLAVAAPEATGSVGR